MRRLIPLFLALSLSAAAAAADEPSVDPDQVVRVEVTRQYGQDSERHGFWIDREGHLLSELRSLGADATVTVERMDGSAIGEAEVVAHASGANVALLHVADAGTTVEPLTWSRALPDVGDRLFGVEADGGSLSVRRGSVSQFLDEQDFGVMRHNALVARESVGLPLLNRCGEIVGMTLTNPDFLDRLFGNADPRASGVAYAAHVDWLRAFTGDRDVEIARADEVCLSAEEAAARAIEEKEGEVAESRERAEEVEERLEKAREEMEDARERRERIAEEAEALRKRLEEAESATAEDQEKLQEALAAAEEQLEAARRDARQAEKDVADLQSTFERLRAENQRQERLIRYGAAGAVAFLALILLGVVLMRRRAARETTELSDELAQVRGREDEQREFEQRVAATPDVLLELHSPEGERFGVKLEARKLVSSAGAVVGRSPNEADCVVGHEDISRRHARFYMAGNQLVVEDLDSVNGTFVDGEAVADEPTPLDSGAEIGLGALRGRVRY